MEITTMADSHVLANLFDVPPGRRTNRSSWLTIAVVAIALVASLFVSLSPGRAAAAEPTPNVTFETMAMRDIDSPNDITAGPDGNLWFTNGANGSIGRITPDGIVTNFTGDGISIPLGITAGPDGNLWFANGANGSIGRITPDGIVTNFTGTGISQPYGITEGPDGNLWFTNYGNNSIGRITPDGIVTNFTGDGISYPQGITAGPDGNLWFTSFEYHSIGRITPDGVVTNFTGAGIFGPWDITAGPDGNLWFTNYNSIGRITPEGVVSNFTGTGISWPQDITTGPDGNLWFTNYRNDSIGRITPEGVVSNFTGDGISDPNGIAAGPDDNLWFTNNGNNSIGRITLDGVVSNFTGNGISDPRGITAGPDGNLWFTNYGTYDDDLGSNVGSFIARITPEGVVSEFTGDGIYRPEDITAGPDGNLWFTNYNSIGRITPEGVVSNFTGTGISNPRGITTGPDGSLWFTNYNSIGRITPEGVVSEFTGDGISSPQDITAGPDGNLWFTNNGNNSIGRITPEGVVSNFTGTGISNPRGITTGPDGNLWFTNYNSIGRITPEGVVSNFTGTGISWPQDTTTGPDGNLWFTNYRNDSIGRITPEGVVSNFTGTGISNPQDITTGPDGNLWFTNYNSIMRATLSAPAAPSAPRNPSGTAGNAQATVTWTAPASNGGPAITSYEVTSTPGSKTCTTTGALNCTVSGLTNGIAYTFTVTATNAVGTSPASDPSIPVTPTAPVTAPSAPGTPSATAGNAQATVTWTAPASNGGSAILRYSVTSSPESKTCSTNGGLSCVVSDLTNGVAYTFTVTAHNAVGISPASVASNSVTPTAPATGAFHPMAPARIIDSRPSTKVGQYSTPWGAGTTRDISVAGVAGVPGDATGVVLNVTGVSPSASTYLTIWPKGSPKPTASNLNLPPGDVRPNLVMTKLGTGGKVSLYNYLGNTDVVVDVVGWYGPGGDASLFNELSPTRIWDTRTGPGATGKLGQGQTKNLKVTGVGGVPGDATAVVMNVTAVNPSASTYLTAWPKGSTKPTASNLNVPPGEVRPNLVVAKVGTDGKVSFYNNAGNTDLVVDVVGYFADTGSQFSGMTPKRVWDSRPAPENVGPLGKLGQGQFKSIQVTGTNGVPADAKAVVVNITGVSPTLSTYITAWPTGETQPTASNLNLTPNTVIPNLAVVKVGSNGKISFYNYLGTTDIVVDIVGWYS